MPADKPHKAAEQASRGLDHSEDSPDEAHPAALSGNITTRSTMNTPSYESKQHTPHNAECSRHLQLAQKCLTMLTMLENRGGFECQQQSTSLARQRQASGGSVVVTDQHAPPPDAGHAALCGKATIRKKGIQELQTQGSDHTSNTAVTNCMVVRVGFMG